jgi:hypothetical protein
MWNFQIWKPNPASSPLRPFLTFAQKESGRRYCRVVRTPQRRQFSSKNNSIYFLDDIDSDKVKALISSNTKPGIETAMCKILMHHLQGVCIYRNIRI